LKIGVRFFSPLDRVIGLDTLDLELPDPASGADLICQLQQRFVDILPVKFNLMLMVNQKYAKSEVALKDGDQVTVIPWIGCCH
jgi:molybdopterin converting factor small subunit